MRTTAIDGVLLIDKPPGLTSHDVVAVARRALHTRRIGHTGTLDPFATGLLVLLVGRATRLAQFVDDEPKVYDATIEFGAETTTDDLTGDVTRTIDPPDASHVDRAIQTLTGRIQQLPPAYSAKKVGGRRAYAAARAGLPVDLEPVEILVQQWRIRKRAPTTLEVTITCGGGTYIRALGRDLGRAAGSAAHLTALRRTRSGVFDVRNAIALEEIENGVVPRLLPLSSAIPHLPTQLVTEDELRRVRHGNSIDAQVDSILVALIDASGDLVALARRDGAILRPRVVMHNA